MRHLSTELRGLESLWHEPMGCVFPYLMSLIKIAFRLAHESTHSAFIVAELVACVREGAIMAAVGHRGEIKIRADIIIQINDMKLN